jgi:bloom syndrome protein
MKSRVSPSRKKPPKLATKPNPTPAVANSTNVSSPVQETFKRRNAQCEQEDDVDSNDGFDTPALVHNGYACDDFVVDDDDDEEDDYLQPVSRGLAHPSRKLLREGGEPITTDLTMDALTQVHKLVVEHFVREGREVCQKIMMSKNLRSQPFTDLVLREMAIHFPADLKALLKIKDINPEMAKLYGPRLLRLVAKTKTDYDQMMRPADYSVVQKPRDPNRETVINLISDDDPEQCASEDSTDGEFDETSSHFPDRSLGSQSKSAEIETVENFNAKYLAQQNNAVVARPTSQTKTSVQGKARHGARRNTPNNSKTGGIKGHRKGSGSFRPNKRKGSGGGKNKGSRDSRGGRGGGSGHGGGGIGMMPV